MIKLNMEKIDKLQHKAKLLDKMKSEVSRLFELWGEYERNLKDRSGICMQIRSQIFKLKKMVE